jgi:hypothetical protein
MALINQGGKLLLQNGALASGAACCCNKCSGPCDSENPCPEGCACVDGECVTSPCSGPCGCQEQDFACSVIFFDTEEEANQFCQDPAKIFRNCDIYDPAVNPLPDQGERWGVDYCECTAPSACPEGCACVDGECVECQGICCIQIDGADAPPTLQAGYTQQTCEDCEDGPCGTWYPCFEGARKYAGIFLGVVQEYFDTYEECVQSYDDAGCVESCIDTNDPNPLP